MLGNSVRPIGKGLLAEAVILISSVRPLVWNQLIVKVFRGQGPKIVMPDIVFR